MLASSRPETLSPLGGASSTSPGMQRANAATSDISRHTVSRG